jgi:hypothetical protein
MSIKSERIAELVKKANSRMLKNYDEIEDPDEVSFMTVSDFIIIKYKDKSGIIERSAFDKNLWKGYFEVSSGNTSNMMWFVGLKLLDNDDIVELNTLLRS